MHREYIRKRFVLFPNVFIMGSVVAFHAFQKLCLPITDQIPDDRLTQISQITVKGPIAPIRG